MQIEAGPTGPQHSDGFERSSFLGSPWTHIHILAGALGPGVPPVGGTTGLGPLGWGDCSQSDPRWIRPADRIGQDGPGWKANAAQITGGRRLCASGFPPSPSPARARGEAPR